MTAIADLLETMGSTLRRRHDGPIGKKLSNAQQGRHTSMHAKVNSGERVQLKRLVCVDARNDMFELASSIG